MVKQVINIGTSPNKGDGDPIRVAFDKINDNFTELYAASTMDPTNFTSSIIPDTNNAYDLGSLTNAWSDLHVNDFIYLGGNRISISASGALLVNGSLPPEVQDTIGSVFGDDSTLLVDGINNSINLDGTVKGDIVPDTDVAYDLGSATNRFRDLYLSGSTIDLGGTTLSIVGGNLQIGGTDIKDVVTAAGIDYTEIQNTPTIPTAVSELTNDAGYITLAEVAGEITVNPTGDLQGSVFADDSTLLVDGVNGKIVGPVDTTTVSANEVTAGQVTSSIQIASPLVYTQLIEGAENSHLNIRTYNVAEGSPFNVIMKGGSTSDADIGEFGGSVIINGGRNTGRLEGHGRVEIGTEYTNGITIGTTDGGDGFGSVVELRGFVNSIGQVDAGSTDIYGDVEFNNGTTSFQSGQTLSVNTNNFYAREIHGPVDGSLYLGGRTEFAKVNNLAMTASITYAQTDFEISNNSTLSFGAGSGIDFTNATVTGLSITGQGFTYNELEGTSEIGVSADVFDFGDGKTIDMQNSSILFTGSTISGINDLTLSGDIRSENAINIDINLSDSTLRRWTFGEDGDLNLPGAIRTAASNIAIGNGAGETNQSVSATAIGFLAGQTNQGIGAVALGDYAGNSGQVLGAIAIGSLTGALDQGFRAIAIGSIAGNTRQGQYGIGVGYGAGGFEQGDYAIAIGYQAGSSGQATKSIVLNANDSGLQVPESGFYVNPIRNVDGGAFLNYNVSTKEIGYSNDIRSENAINIDINLTDSTTRTWRFGEDGDLTLPNGQQIDTTDADLLLIGTSNAGLKLNSVSQSALLTAKKSFEREFMEFEEGATFTAVPGDPPKITVELSNNEGAYLKELLRRLEIKLLNENDDFPYAYNNITIALRPANENITANVILVEEVSLDPLTYEITIDQDPTSVVGNLDYIQIRYDYENTIGVDVDRDIFGIATDNDDIDIISGRDIDLRAGDDISILANSTFDLTLARNDFQSDTDGLEITTDDPNTASYTWRFQFDGNLSVPGAIIGDGSDLELSSTIDVNINTSVGNENHTFEFSDDGTFYMAKNPIGNISYISTPRNDTNANLNLVSALDLTITTNESDVTKEWAFGRDGSLTLPGTLTLADSISFGSSNGYEALVDEGGTLYLKGTDSDNDIIVRTNASGGGQNDFIFGKDASLTLPGAVVSTPESPAGGTDLVGEAATIIVTNGPNLNWNSTGVFANGINFTFIVDGSGNATVVVNDGGTGHTVGETFSLGGVHVGGTSPADDVNFEITSIVESRTALSLTKQVQILEDGFYTLADGDEGQIMYFVPASGTTTGTYVNVANARIIDVGNTDLPVDDTEYSWTPFFGETEAPTTIAMAIFADGAWCLRGGVQD
jgi:hypothetical protein